MKCKGFFVCFFLSFILIGFAQKSIAQKPNYKKIKKLTFKKKSDFYYLKLAKKFTKGHNMSLEEKRAFYYGFAFRYSYEPYKISKSRKQINSILQKKVFNKSTLNELDVLIRTELSDNPFDIELHNLHIFVYKKLRLKDKVLLKLKQIQVIKDAILSTGNGKTKKTAYHVIFVKNEYDILKLLQIKAIKHQFIDKNYECVLVEENTRGIKKVFFNITMCAKSIRQKL